MTLKLISLWNRSRDFVLRLPTWVQVLLIFAASRLWGFIVFSVVARQQLSNPWTADTPTYTQFIGFWDSGWYKQAATDGYPSELPMASNGSVRQSTWAFYPIFPLLASALNDLTGMGFTASGAWISVISGFLTALVLYKLFQEGLLKTSWGQEQSGETRRSLSLWAVAIFGFLPVSAVLQVPYAESFNLLFLSLTFLMIIRGEWLLALPNALVTALSRPVGVPLGAAVGIFWLVCAVQKYRDASRTDDAKSSPTSYIGAALKNTWLQLLSALLICFFALLWPIYAWIKTGRVDAYTATETAWRGENLAPVTPWFTQAHLYFGSWGIVVFGALVIGVIALLCSKLVRRSLPTFLIIWCASYFAYIVLFLNPQSSTFRLLLPVFPLVLPLVAISTSKAYRWAILISCALGQLWWVSWLWHWKQLPGGGDYPP